MKNRISFKNVFVLATLVALPLAATISAQAAPSPFVTSVRTVDGNTNGFIDRVDVTFSQGMNEAAPEVASGPGQPGLSVAGYTILTPMSWIAPPGSPNGTPKSILMVSVAERTSFDTDATPLVRYVPGSTGKDLKTSLGTALSAWDVPATDGAGALLLSVTAKDYGANGLFESAGDQLALRFTEPVSVIGATPAERWTNLERAITFAIVPSSGGSCTDGVGLVTDRNFPRATGVSDDAIAAPTPGATASTITVRMIAGNQGSTTQVAGVPVGCRIGVALDEANRAGIRDIANVAVAPITVDARKLLIYPGDVSLVSAVTADAAGAPDGLVDAVKVTFDLPMDDSTVAANLSNFSVNVGGANVPITSFSTGTTANDANLTFLLGQTFGGGTTSNISYTRHASCASTPSGSTGSGVKAFVLAGFDHRACLGSFDTPATDGVSPVLKSAATADADANGIIDGATVTFSEAVTSGTADGWTIDGAPVTSFTANGTTATLGIAEGGIGGSSTPSVGYTVPASNPTADAAGNGIATSSVQATDGVSPRLSTVTVRDIDADGNVDAGDFTFTEPVTAGAGAASAFGLGETAGAQIISVEGSVVKVGFAGLTGSAARAATFTPTTGSIQDAAGLAPTAATIAVASVIDGAPPIASIEIAPNAPVGPGQTTITGAFSEPMDAATAPTVTFAGRAVSGAWKSSGDAWEGTITIASGDCTVATGCEVEALIAGAKDARGNAQAAVASRKTEIDTVAPVAPTAFTVGATPQAPAGYVNLESTAVSLTFPVTAGDAGGGTAELILDGTVVPESSKPVSASTSTVTAVATYASNAALKTAIPAGEHQLGVKLCDDARNCTTVATAKALKADHTAIPVQITTSIEGVLAGGSTKDIAWDGDDIQADLDDLTISYSTDGTTFSPIASKQAIDGTKSWTVPEVDSADARIRAQSTDKAGNKFAYTTPRFTIDSTAPVVAMTAPSANSPFLGNSAAIRWTATDVSFEDVQKPISIEYSLNGGKTWLSINGGSYSSSNDGVETWKVPSTKALDARVRVTATDGTGRSTEVESGRFATGVRGFVVARGGMVYGFGASSTSVTETLTSKGDVARGVGVRRDGRTGYVLRNDGRLYPFAEAGSKLPPKRSSTIFKGGIARGIAMTSDTSGYTLDAYGRVYPFGGASKVTTSRTWVGKDLARGIVMRADKRGGYVLDAYGKLHPFRVGRYSMPKNIQSGNLSSTKQAVSVALLPGDRSGYVLDSTGRLLRFGGAAQVSNTGVSKTADAQAIIPVTATGGYWVNGRGVLTPYGKAFGAPAKFTMRSGWARAAG